MGQMIIVPQAQLINSLIDCGYKPAYRQTTSQYLTPSTAVNPPIPVEYVRDLQPKPILLDPMVEYVRWYAPFKSKNTKGPPPHEHILLTQSLHSTEENLRFRYWERAEFIRWIEQEAIGIVLVQYTHHEDSFRMVFIEQADYEKYFEFAAQPKPHAVTIQYKSSSDRDIITKWISNNISGEYEFLRNYESYSNDLSAYVISFRSLEDAVFVRLRFSEPVDEAVKKAA